MSQVVQRIENRLRDIGYRADALVSDYRFADVMSPGGGSALRGVGRVYADAPVLSLGRRRSARFDPGRC
jgi:hypothetical protein